MIAFPIPLKVLNPSNDAILKHLGKPESLITYVTDRPGHDLRYAIDSTKIENELGWTRTYNFEEGIRNGYDAFYSEIVKLNNIISNYEKTFTIVLFLILLTPILAQDFKYGAITLQDPSMKN